LARAAWHFSNNTSDPFRETQRYWYGRDIRVPTLWQAADQAGIVTASVNWPVTVAVKECVTIPSIGAIVLQQTANF
jgi:hypothetical protein